MPTLRNFALTPVPIFHPRSNVATASPIVPRTRTAGETRVFPVKAANALPNRASLRVRRRKRPLRFTKRDPLGLGNCVVAGRDRLRRLAIDEPVDSVPAFSGLLPVIRIRRGLGVRGILTDSGERTERQQRDESETYLASVGRFHV